MSVWYCNVCDHTFDSDTDVEHFEEHYDKKPDDFILIQGTVTLKGREWERYELKIPAEDTPQTDPTIINLFDME